MGGGYKINAENASSSANLPPGGASANPSHAGPKKKWLQKEQVQTGNLNGLSQSQPLFRVKPRRNRADDFKRMIEEIPKLPDMSDFEALRPFTDNNLISEDVRKLTHGKLSRLTPAEFEKKAKVFQKLFVFSEKLAFLTKIF